ncbi:MAG: hypothetical protein MJ178_10610, partial [Treponemataceae bacterium]|nr:hypothetical protein [Treponemataceae bacterium]
DNELQLSVSARNCNMEFTCESATGYFTWFETEDEDTYVLGTDGWERATKKQLKFIKKAVKDLEAYNMEAGEWSDVDGSPVGDTVWISELNKKEKSVEYTELSYIPFSSHLSKPGKLVNAAYGTFYTSCLMENGQCLTFSLRPDFYLFNNEYYLLDDTLDTIDNQVNILGTVFDLQGGRADPADYAPEMEIFAQPEILPQFIAESIWNNEAGSVEGYPLYASYDVAGTENGYLIMYLQQFYFGNLPIEYSTVQMYFGYNYGAMNPSRIDAEKGAELAALAVELAPEFDDSNLLVDAVVQKLDIGFTTFAIDVTAFHIFDTEAQCVIVPDYSLVTAGDLLVNNRNEDNPYGIVLSVADDAESRDDITVLWLDDTDATWKETAWSQMPNAAHYCCRHLLDIE